MSKVADVFRWPSVLIEPLGYFNYKLTLELVHMLAIHLAQRRGQLSCKTDFFAPCPDFSNLYSLKTSIALEQSYQ